MVTAAGKMSGPSRRFMGHFMVPRVCRGTCCKKDMFKSILDLNKRVFVARLTVI